MEKERQREGEREREFDRVDGARDREHKKGETKWEEEGERMTEETDRERQGDWFCIVFLPTQYESQQSDWPPRSHHELPPIRASQ